MLRRLFPLVVLVALIVSGCSSSDGASDETPASSTTTASVTSPVPTVVASTTTTPVETTTTALPDRWRYAGDDHGYAYQSLGYSCEADPATGCEGDHDMSLVQIMLHKDEKNTGGESSSADCLDIMMKPQPGSSYDFMDMMGSTDDPTFVSTGWGIRIVQLDSPPTGFDIGGKAWLELTVSSLSATEYAALLPKRPGTGGFVKYSAPTNDDPVSIETVPDTTNFIEELILVETTNDMMQWIIVLNEDETFRHYAGYWGGSGGGWTDGLFVKIGR